MYVFKFSKLILFPIVHTKLNIVASKMNLCPYEHKAYR